MMVKGTSRQVIVVDSPDPKLFEQAIFIVKNDAFSGVSSQQILGEACRIAKGCTAVPAKKPAFRIPWWGWTALGAMASAGLMLLLLL